jgi:hypothetical protein
MTQVRKGNGHELALRWGWWHVAMMCEAAGVEAVFEWPGTNEGADPATGTFTMPHDFSVCDVSDREELTFRKGWVLNMWRS